MGERLGWLKSSLEYRNFDRIDGGPMEFEWNIFPGFNTLQLSAEVKSLLLKLKRHQRISQEEFFACRCSTTSPLDQETMKNNACQMPISFLYMRKDLEKDNGHLLVLVPRKSGTLSVKIVRKESGQYGGKNVVGIRGKRMSNSPCYKSIVQMSTQKQRSWKIVDTPFCRFGND